MADVPPPSTSAFPGYQKQTSEWAQPLAQTTFSADTIRLPKVAETIVENGALLTSKQSSEDASAKRTKLPRTSKAKLPSIKGYIWRPNGAGWDARKLVTLPSGLRKQPFVAHLSASAHSELRRKHRTDNKLATALADWIAERESEKGIT